jgi:AP-3 complex subunit mu
LKYTINEVYIDVIEYINCILDRHGNFIRFDISGEVMVNTSLSGMPDLSMFMHMPHKFASYSLHPCAFPRRKRFESENVVCFIPPDSKFVALKYTIDDISPPLPIRVTPSYQHYLDSSKLEIRVESRMIGSERPVVDNMQISINFPKHIDPPITESSVGSY